MQHKQEPPQRRGTVFGRSASMIRVKRDTTSNDLQAIERRLMRSITVMSSSYTPGRPRSDGH